MPVHEEIQYITDEEGRPTGVIVPIDLWRRAGGQAGGFVGGDGTLESTTLRRHRRLATHGSVLLLWRSSKSLRGSSLPPSPSIPTSLALIIVSMKIVLPLSPRNPCTSLRCCLRVPRAS